MELNQYLLSYKVTLWAILLLLFPTTYQYGQSQIEINDQKLETYQTYYPQEKVYIHHDKSYYVSGETLWFKAYLVDASQHSFLTPSQIVRVELVADNGKILKELISKIENGGAAGDFYIDPEWTAGTYILRAYTQYMRNYEEVAMFQKEIRIYPSIEKAKFAIRQSKNKSTSKEFNVQFFPEGGDLVASLSSKVSFKATDEQGKGITITGQVVDEKDVAVTKLISFPLGFGFFKFKPNFGKTYKAVVMYEGETKTFDLPTALSEGYVLQINNQKAEEAVLQVKTTHPSGLKDAFLIGHIRGQIFCRLSSLEVGTIYRLPKVDLPSGVAHFTLFNGAGVPIAERLLFIDNDPDTDAILSTPKSDFSKREKVTLAVELPATETFQLANLSISVTDQYIAPSLSSDRAIKSYLLLESEVKGAIENPSYYFDQTNSHRAQILDLLLLTQGWRRFTWQDLLSNSLPSFDYPIENHFTISGIVTKKGNKNKPIKADVLFSSLAKDMKYNKVTTEEDGRFVFDNLHFTDTTTIILQANQYKSKRKKKKEELQAEGNRKVDIHLDEYPSPSLDKTSVFPFQDTDFQIQEQEVYDIDFARLQTLADENIWEIDFEEVVVRGRRKEQLEEWHKGRSLYRAPDNRVHLDSFPSVYHTNIFDFLKGKVPGVEIIGTGFEKTARIRGTNSISLNTTATILFDGMQVESSLANSIDPSRIAFVDVIKSYEKVSIYGEAGSGGIIALYSRPPGEMKGKKVSQNGVLNVKHPGYYQAREFYSPVYLADGVANKDYRVTLYWNPIIYLKEKERAATLEFYTADRATEYEVKLEGVTDTGKIFVENLRFTVE